MKRVRVIPRMTVSPALLFFIMACSNSSDGNRNSYDPRALRPLTVRADIHLGGAVVDDREQEVVLRGVNVNSLVEYWQGNEFPTTFPFTESDAKAIFQQGRSRGLRPHE